MSLALVVVDGYTASNNVTVTSWAVAVDRVSVGVTVKRDSAYKLKVIELWVERGGHRAMRRALGDIPSKFRSSIKAGRRYPSRSSSSWKLSGSDMHFLRRNGLSG